MMENISDILSNVIHPETGSDIVSGGFVENISETEDKLTVTLRLKRPRDPFALSVKREIIEKISAARPSLNGKVTVILKEPAPVVTDKNEKKTIKQSSGGSDIGNIIAISSGKGGYGNYISNIRSAG